MTNSVSAKLIDIHVIEVLLRCFCCTTTFVFNAPQLTAISSNNRVITPVTNSSSYRQFFTHNTKTLNTHATKTKKSKRHEQTINPQHQPRHPLWDAKIYAAQTKQTMGQVITEALEKLIYEEDGDLSDFSPLPASTSQ